MTDREQLLEQQLIEERAAREQAEQQLEQKSSELYERNLELARSNNELEQFAYVASHDLQAPLRTISGFAQLLSRSDAEHLSGDGKEFLELIEGSVASMRALIDDLLEFSRAQRAAVPDEPVPLDEVMQEVRQRLVAQLEECGGEISAGPLPVVSGNQGQITQLFQNLIGNGLKFAKPDVPPVVTVSAEAVNGNAIVEFADNGIGIMPEHLDKVFEMFKRLHTQDEYAGTGIGLALCRKIAERHNGSLSLRSEFGQGTTFVATLPLS